MRALFVAGYTFSLTANPRDAWNRKYLLTAVTHHADQVPLLSGRDTEADAGYSNRFTAVSSDIVFKPLQTWRSPAFTVRRQPLWSSEKAAMRSSSTARVGSRSSFFWDKLNSDSSTVDCTWVRVAQGWAGNGWGSYFWPRVKDEVVVQFPQWRSRQSRSSPARFITA
jgi:type VI secretion system secreted protein VgrG